MVYLPTFNQLNVGTYTIHGSYGVVITPFRTSRGPSWKKEMVVGAFFFPLLEHIIFPPDGVSPPNPSINPRSTTSPAFYRVTMMPQTWGEIASGLLVSPMVAFKAFTRAASPPPSSWMCDSSILEKRSIPIWSVSWIWLFNSINALNHITLGLATSKIHSNEPVTCSNNPSKQS